MRNGLYHEAVYMPEMTLKSVDAQLRYTWHALNRADEKGIDNLPDYINFANTELIELEVVRGKPYKVVVREHYDLKHDLCLVILLKDLTVKTVWLNSKNDKHQTLDASRYNKGK